MNVIRPILRSSRRFIYDGKSAKLLPMKLFPVTPCLSDHTPHIMPDHPGPLYVMSLFSASGLNRPSEINASMAGVSEDSRQSERNPSIPMMSTRASSV